VKASSATCPKVLLLLFSFWTKTILSMIVTHGVGISSAAGTFFSSSVSRAALFVIFHVSRRRHEMYSGPARLCVCLSLTAFPYYYTDPDVTWGNGRGFRPVVNYWAGLQSMHRFRCCDNIARTRNVSKCLYPLLCLVFPSVPFW